MRLIRTRLLGLLSAIALAIPAFAAAQPGYLCRMTGQVSTSCCCAKKHTKQCGPEVTRGSCCQLIEADHSVAPSATPDTSRSIAGPVVLTILERLPLSREVRTHAPEPARITHPPGPARFLVKCSFLI